ncbi:MAG: hypothetical protein EA370_14850 [Wenzhouxiangella sp.]|nr:MAG: hypothetical protein EA370_14850 [Wenzhouxiangella sp.]
MAETDVKPWYKEPWPFILISITGLGVVAGSTLAFIGLSNPPEIVSGDFEQLGRGLTDTNVRTAQARALGLSGVLQIDGQRVILELAATDAGSLPDSLLIQFQHPATSDLDRVVVLQRQSAGRYDGSLDEAPHPRSRIVVADLPQSWWLAGRLDGQIQTAVDLVPKRL